MTQFPVRGNFVLQRKILQKTAEEPLEDSGDSRCALRVEQLSQLLPGTLTRRAKGVNQNG